MKSELNKERKIQDRVGSVVKEVKLLFPVELGGDIILEPGDFVCLSVVDKGFTKETKKRPSGQ